MAIALPSAISTSLPTGPRGRVLAVSLAAVVLAVAWFGAAMPLRDWYLDRAEGLRRQQAMARRMAALVETLPTLRRQVEAENGTGTVTLLSGATDAIAAASLQQQIDELAARSGVRVGSEEILSATPEGMLRAVAVRLTVAASYQSLLTFLRDLATSETPMIVDELQLRGPAPTTKDVDETIDASLSIVSYRAAETEAK